MPAFNWLMAGLFSLALSAAPPALPAPSVVQVRGVYAEGILRLGSGVVVAPGVVATNAHVVAGAESLVIRQGELSWVVKEVCVEADRDLSLLRIPGLALPVAEPARAEDFRPGQAVAAIGYPGGAGPSVRPGTLVSTWAFRGDRLLQTDAELRPGSSGGGLFNADGRLLGITTFVLSGAGRASFAVPISWIQSLLTGDARAAGLVCPGVPIEDVGMAFADHMTEDPANWASWETLVHAWVRDAPEDPFAWYALGNVLALKRLNESPAPALEQQQDEAFRRAVALKPDFAKAWNNLGASLDAVNRFTEAQRALEQALRLDPRYGIAYLNLGACLINQTHLPEAAEALKQGVALVPDDALGWSRLAFCEGSTGHWQEAAEHFRIATALSPFRPTWWANYALACLEARDHVGVARAMARLKLLDPDLFHRMAKVRHGDRLL